MPQPESEMAMIPELRYSLQRGAFEPHRMRAKVLQDDRVPETDACFLPNHFPQELQNMVWEYLEPRDLTLIRATCKELANSVRAPWIKGTFGEVSINFTKEHIRNLDVALTANAAHAAVVKSLRVYSHIRDINLASNEGALLRGQLAAVIAKMPQLTSVTVVSESFEGTGVYVIPDADLQLNGVNCDLRHVLVILHDNPNKVTKFSLESVTGRHRLHQSAFKGNIIPDFEDISVLDCGELTLNDEQGLGTYGVPANFVDRFKTVTTLNFGGHGHLVRGCEMARLLNDVRLPALKNVHLSNSTFFENDMLQFCFEHQKTLELIDFKKMTLRAFCFDYLIKDIIAYDNDWASEGPLDMAMLKIIRVTQACESWHFDRSGTGEGNEDVHRAIIFVGMEDDYDGYWEHEVLEVHGRGNSKHDQDYADFLADEFGRVVLDKEIGCKEAYHQCRDPITELWKEFEGDDTATMEEFDDGNGVVEFGGVSHDGEASWWHREALVFYSDDEEE